MRFYKGQALGNDYLVIDEADLDAPFTPARAVRLCDRHRGAGSDGVLLADVAARPVALRIINPDGTEAEKSGNGLRIFAAYLFHRGLVQRGEWFDVRLPTDTVGMRVEDVLAADGGVARGAGAGSGGGGDVADVAATANGGVLVRVRMGAADFRGAAVGFAPEPGVAQGVELSLGDAGSAEVNTVSLGNPHCVVFVDELVRSDFLARAPRLCSHDAFARGTNVQFARAAGPHELEVWIWERGAGETLASGSSACAAAAAAVRRGLAAPGQITVQMPGGSLEVTVTDDFDIELLGPAQMVYEGRTV